jgi:phospholipid/cholesterol/gamma-HCH transport system substrate-binding protein
MTQEDRVRIRHTDRWVGAIVVLALAVFLATLFQRSVIREWFAGGSQLTIILPEEGVAGLAVGAEAEVLGIRVGSVREIIVAPELRIRAELRIDEQARGFIRSDSVATVRRRFGVAGPAYLDISRGQGAELDWRSAVIEARVEAAAMETAGALLEDLRQRIFPVLDDLQRGMRSFADAAGRLNSGEGTVGRLLTDDTLARQAEDATGRVNTILGTVNEATREVRVLTSALSGVQTTGAGQGQGQARGRGQQGRNNTPDGSLPALLRRADRTLASLERVSQDLARASPSVPRVARNVAEGTEPLPSVVVQAQETARELEMLLTQLRGNWLLGGGGGPAPRDSLRPAADRVRP